MVAPNRASSTIFRLALWPKLSFNGFFETLPSDLSWANNGDSFIRKRMYIDTTTSKMETQKGMRHPQSLKRLIDVSRSGARKWRVNNITPSEKKRPRVAVVWIQLV